MFGVFEYLFGDRLVLGDVERCLLAVILCSAAQHMVSWWLGALHSLHFLLQLWSSDQGSRHFMHSPAWKHLSLFLADGVSKS